MIADAREAVAVVTGSAQGLGEAIAIRFARDGYRVVCADVNDELNRTTAAAIDETGERAVAIRVDVRELNSVQGCLDDAVRLWGRADVWVNNAARTEARPFLEIEPDEWDDVLAVNLRGTYFGCRVAGRHMSERGAGRILNLASLAGQWGRSPTGAHYAASKAGIIALTRYAATAFAASGVTVNAIAPAAIEGPAVAAMPPEQVADYAAQIPVGRLGRPEEVAALVAFLASDEAGFVTGATYDLNGGLLMR
jgi:3-oxoacyl-[acyl-carrier protein] reductase